MTLDTARAGRTEWGRQNPAVLPQLRFTLSLFGVDEDLAKSGKSVRLRAVAGRLVRRPRLRRREEQSDTLATASGGLERPVRRCKRVPDGLATSRENDRPLPHHIGYRGTVRKPCVDNQDGRGSQCNHPANQSP